MELSIRNIELRKFFLFLACCIAFYQSVRSQSHGLEFKGFDVILDERTELELTSDESFKFKNEFEISFDYKAIRTVPNSNAGLFGYIFRIIYSEEENIDLISATGPQLCLNLVLGKSNEVVHIAYPEEMINEWINLRIKFFLDEDRIVFYTPDSSYVQQNIGFERTESFKIFFGANDYMFFKSSDVPTMAIKDIEIHENDKLKHNWPLDEKQGNIARDVINGEKARVINPSWLALTHQKWQKVFEDEIDGVISVAADNETGNIYLVGKDQLTLYSTQNDRVRRLKYQNEPIFFDQNYRAIFNTTDGRIYCYIADQLPFYSLNIQTGKWSEPGEPVNFQTKYRHHNSYYRPEDNSIYTFGGYGGHRYSNSIYKIDLSDSKINELSTDHSIFSPRYLAGSAGLNDTIYILGGYGSVSGNQLINPHSYFGLVGYSFHNGNLFEKFDIPRIYDDMVVGNKMYIDEQTREFYALVFSKVKFENNLQVIKGNLDEPKVEKVGDQIPFKFLDIRTFVNLYYMPGKDKLYAYVSYTTDITTQIAVYSINYPPNKSELKDELTRNEKNWLVIIVVLAVLLLSGVFLYFHRRRNRKNKSRKHLTKEPYVLSTFKNGGKAYHHENYNMIFFGGFQILDKNYNDITNKFSPLLKELFLLILLHTYKNNKGISSNKIVEVLWRDKSERSARNNRAVNIAKLKGILTEIGKCELSKKTGYWKIDFSEAEVKSDYLEFLKITSSPNLNKEKINHLIGITEKGAFLSNVHYEWLDEFKALVSDRILDTLIEFGQSIDVKDNADFIIHLADSVFNFDIVNEEAMILKCKAQYCMGKHSLALATYEKFCKEYKIMYGQDYEKEFTVILNS
jgi:two-component SAPR family response regulator